MVTKRQGEWGKPVGLGHTHARPRCAGLGENEAFTRGGKADSSKVVKKK